MTSTKLRILAKITYGDFDMPIQTPVFASTNKEVLQAKAIELNATLSEEEKEDGIKYKILSETVKLI